jgi:hypothetical protein
MRGAPESEVASRPDPGWEGGRQEREARVLRVDGDLFTQARTEGRLLSIARAAGLDASIYGGLMWPVWGGLSEVRAVRWVFGRGRPILRGLRCSRGRMPVVR